MAYQARQLAFHKFLHRTWTYLGQVFVQRFENEEPIKIFEKEDLPHHDKLAEITTPRQPLNRFQVTPNASPRDDTTKRKDTAVPIAKPTASAKGDWVMGK